MGSKGADPVVSIYLYVHVNLLEICALAFGAAWQVSKKSRILRGFRFGARASLFYLNSGQDNLGQDTTTDHAKRRPYSSSSRLKVKLAHELAAH